MLIKLFIPLQEFIPHFDVRRNDSYVKALNAFVLETKCKVKFTKLIDLLYKLNAYSYLVV